MEKETNIQSTQINTFISSILLKSFKLLKPKCVLVRAWLNRQQHLPSSWASYVVRNTTTHMHGLQNKSITTINSHLFVNMSSSMKGWGCIFVMQLTIKTNGKFDTCNKSRWTV